MNDRSADTDLVHDKACVKETTNQQAYHNALSWMLLSTSTLLRLMYKMQRHRTTTLKHFQDYSGSTQEW